MAYRLTAATLILAALCFCATHAGDYLSYSEAIQPAYAVVLFVGPDMQARRKAADQILCQGLARYLIVPAHGQVYRCLQGGEEAPELISPPTIDGESVQPVAVALELLRIAEDTHIEMLMAYQTIQRSSLEATVFVSSPYHMRRIKIMADRLFEASGLETRFVATPYETTGGNLWWTDRRQISWVLIPCCNQDDPNIQSHPVND
jgi:uncharacterized SAM-binding protein YcdF (DUF218 family)